MRARAETAPVKVGQVWRDNDKRAGFRELKVNSIDGRFAFCAVRLHPDAGFNRETRISINRMRPTTTGYRLISEAL